MPRFCTRCGTSNDDEARFCKDCGAALSAQDVATTSPSTESEPPRSAVSSARDGGPMAQAGAQGEDGAPAAGSGVLSDLARDAEADAPHPEPESGHEQARLAAIAARIKAQDKARAAALAAARISVVADVTRSPKANDPPAPMHGHETVSQARSANGARAGRSTSSPVMDTQRRRMTRPVSALALLAIAGGAYWWMHTRQVANTHESTYAPTVAKMSHAATLQRTPGDLPAKRAAAPGPAPAVASLARNTTPQTGLTTAPGEGKQRAQRHAAPAAMQREQPVAQGRREGTHSTPEAKSHVVAGRQTHQRQAEGSAQVANSRQVAQQSSQPVPALQGRVEALHEATAACQTKGNFFSQELCIQRVRWKYCGAPLEPDPLWGKTPECPDSQQRRINP